MTENHSGYRLTSLRNIIKKKKTESTPFGIKANGQNPLYRWMDGICRWWSLHKIFIFFSLVAAFLSTIYCHP